MKEKRRLDNNSKRISRLSFNNIQLAIFMSMLLHYPFQIRKIPDIEKILFQDLLRERKYKNKREITTILNKIRYHRYVAYILNIVYVTKHLGKTYFFMFSWQLYFPLKTFKAALLWYCRSTKIKMTIAAMNYIKQDQLNLSYIEESHINFW